MGLVFGEMEGGRRRKEEEEEKKNKCCFLDSVYRGTYCVYPI
jgi:hypothetical protein